MNCDGTRQRSGALHLTKKVDYGILLLSSLADMDKQTSIQTIAESTKVSLTYLQKIARILKQAGLLTSTRGKHGGYSLTKEPKNMSIKEIIEALEGEIALAPCLKGITTHMCKNKSICKIRGGIEKLNQEIADHLSSKNLSQFI